jgi:hypothetical protein
MLARQAYVLINVCTSAFNDLAHIVAHANDLVSLTYVVLRSGCGLSLTLVALFIAPELDAGTSDKVETLDRFKSPRTYSTSASGLSS